MKRKVLISLSLFIVIIYSCEKAGPAGKNSLVGFINESPGENCVNGGYQIISGLDLNDNNVLDVNEIQDHKFICNGINGSNTLINIMQEPIGENCQSGGYKISTGIDLNHNDTLNINEIQHIEYLCNDTLDHVINLVFAHANDVISSGYATGFIGGAFLPQFNLSDYYGIDSIVFGAYLQTLNVSSKCIVELYDNTNKSVIQGSQISTNSLELKLITTKINFIKNMPSGENDYTIKIRPEINNETAICHSPFIKLFRK